ncbi:putative membrane protein [Clostridioides difficile P32]|nr:putative membrane protein [Clostridioides difficile P32]
MRKWNKFKSERGAALVLVLVVVALLSIVGLIFSNQMLIE